MQVAMIGLGKMGFNMAQRLIQAGHEVVGYDTSRETVKKLAKEGAQEALTLEEVTQKLKTPRVAWLMLPAGHITDKVTEQLANLFEAGDIVIDGGNSFFKDDIRHAQLLRQKGIHHIDVGTSGGVWGKDRGYCLMIGGEKSSVLHCDPLFKSLAPGKEAAPAITPSSNSTAEQGYLHCGPNGSGHFVKMIHNGIEYAVMQSFAEGFDLMKTVNSENIPKERRYQLDVADIAEVWRRGSILGSFLLDMIALGLHKNPELSDFSGFVQDSGEGRWTVETAIEQACPAEVLSSALFARFRSRQDHTFAEKMLSMMRYQFGGHNEEGASSENKKS